MSKFQMSTGTRNEVIERIRAETLVVPATGHAARLWDLRVAAIIDEAIAAELVAQGARVPDYGMAVGDDGALFEHPDLPRG